MGSGSGGSAISIHAPHTGRDSTKNTATATRTTFQSTRPIRGATCLSLRFSTPESQFQSTRPIRGATVQKIFPTGHRRKISIHAPHTGRDRHRVISRQRDMDFNPRAPYGARHVRNRVAPSLMLFQSTRPIRGATRSHQGGDAGTSISIHAPHTGRDLLSCGFLFWLRTISIHAPHTGRDGGGHKARPPSEEFQSTRPIRGATNPPCIIWGIS